MKPLAALPIAAALLVGIVAGPADAHDDADWIRRGGFRDINGQSCCTPTDCKLIPASSVYERADGSFTYLPTGEVIPRNETRQSPDGNFWRCHWYSQGQQVTRKLCFWRPVPPS